MDALRNALLAGLGVMSFGKDKLSNAVAAMVDKGDLTREQGEKVISEWIKRGEDEHSRVGERVTEEIEKVLNHLRVVTRDEFDALEKRIAELEQRAAD